VFPKDKNGIPRSPRFPGQRPGEATIAARRQARGNLARGGFAAVPVVAVNATAFIGQFAFVRQHVPWIFPGQVLFAVTLETVAVYLAWSAHVAAMANDSATRLKLGAYSFALVVGTMNYSHYMSPHWRPTVMAVGMFSMSALSPWLWGIHTRRASRDRLMALGLLEEHAVRLGATRWTWHLFRSMRVMSWSTWHGVNDPKRAISHFEGRYGTDETPEPPRVPRAARKPVIVPAQQSAPVMALPPSAETVPAAGTVAAAQQAGEPLSRAAVPARPPRVPGDYVLAQGQGGTPEARTDPVPASESAARLGASAHLEATARLSPGRRPSQDVLDEVELRLATTPVDELPSEREIARQLGHAVNYRRLAKKVREARIKTGTSLSSAPRSEHVAGNGAGRRQDPSVIATPVQFQPGGSQAHD
jgi:hypothetical protein